jgi:hypothetical protein
MPGHNNAWNAEPVEHVAQYRSLIGRRTAIRAAPLAPAVTGPVDQDEPPSGKALAEREPHVFEIAAGAVDEDDRDIFLRFLRGDISHALGNMLAQTADIDEAAARWMRPRNQHRADTGDNGADDKDDCNTRQHDAAKPPLDP